MRKLAPNLNGEAEIDASQLDIEEWSMKDIKELIRLWNEKCPTIDAEYAYHNGGILFLKFTWDNDVKIDEDDDDEEEDEKDSED